MCALQARGRTSDESGCLFGSWTLPEGRARGEKDKIGVLDEREGEITGFHSTDREKRYRGFGERWKPLMPLMT